MDRINDLTISVDELATEARNIRTELRQKNRIMWAAIVVSAIVMVLLIGVVYTITSNNSDQIEANNKKFCPVLSALAQPGASTQHGVQITEAFRRLEHDGKFDCV